jgi:hypothetical protein
VIVTYSGGEAMSTMARLAVSSRAPPIAVPREAAIIASPASTRTERILVQKEKE